MSIFSNLWTAYEVAQESKDAYAAAKQKLKDGGSIFEAIDAFAAATETPLDDEVVRTLHTTAEQVLTGLTSTLLITTAAITWVDAHRDTLLAVTRGIARAAEQTPALVDRATRRTIDASALLVKLRIRLAALGQRRETL